MHRTSMTSYLDDMISIDMHRTSMMLLTTSSALISSKSMVRESGRKLLLFSQHAVLAVSPSRQVHGSGDWLADV